MSSSTITATSSASALSTIGGQNISDTVRLLIDDTDSSAYEFSNTDLNALLSRAVAIYNTLNPYYKTTTISYVADTQDYALPSDFIRAVHIPYRQSPSITSDNTLLVTMWNTNGFLSLVPYIDWTDDVVNKYQAELTLRLENLGAGQTEVIPYLTSYAATRYIRLYPVPDEAGSFVLRYQANHPILSNDYFTIPTYHARHITDLLVAEVLDVRHTKNTSSVSEFNAGTTKIKVGGGKQTLADKANALRQSVYDALVRPIGAVG